VTKELKNYPKNVDVIPFAENLEDIYNNGKVCICPMFRGTGMKIKVVEAMVYGIPVVCSERGINGLPDKTLSGCLVADEPEEFAQYLIKLTEDEHLYSECKSKIEQYYIRAFARDKYIALLEKVITGN